MGEARTKWVWRVVIVVAAVTGVAVMVGGLFVYVSSPPELRVKRVARIEPTDGESGSQDVCLDDGASVNCYPVVERDLPAFGKPGDCVLVKFIGEGPIRAQRQLSESRCQKLQHSPR